MNAASTIRVTPEGILSFIYSEPRIGRVSPAIFLDRDGVINERIQGGYVTQWSEFRFLAGIGAALAELSGLGLPLIIVSNQAGVGKELVSRETLAEITDRFVSELRRKNARIDAVYYCPHVAEARCSCRKPGVGMLRQAAEDWQINLQRSILVGDSVADLQAAQASQCRAVLLAQQDGQEETASPSEMGWLTIQGAAEIVAGVRQFLREGTRR